MNSAEKKQVARLLMQETNKQYGENTAVVASDLLIPNRITSGSLSLDAALGGGWPVNQWTEVIGEFSSGKTQLVLMSLAANQRIDPDFYCVWLAAEHYDKEYAEMWGVDNSRVLVINEQVMEAAFGRCLKALEMRACDMLVVDSLPAMSPNDEVDKLMEEWTMGLAARMTNKFFRKQGTSGKRSMLDPDDRACTRFLINQFREKIGVTHGDNRTSPGGKGKDFACYTKVEVRRDDWIDIGGRSSVNRVGQTVKVRTTKNKSFPPQRVATYDIYFADAPDHPAGTVDTFKEMISLGIVHGVIEQKGAWFYYQGMQANGVVKLTEILRENEETRALLAKEILEAATTLPGTTAAAATPAKEPAKRTVARKAPVRRPAKKTAAKR